MAESKSPKSGIPRVEEFRVFTKKEADMLSYKERVEAYALIIMLWLQKHSFPKSSLKLEAFTGDNDTLAPKLVTAMQDLLQVLGESAALKKARRSGKIDLDNFDVISLYLNERLVQLIRGSNDNVSIADTPKFCVAIIKFYYIIMELSSHVQRISLDDLATQFFAFNKAEQTRQTAAPIETLIKNDNCYFAAFVPKEYRPKNGSDHVTIAYGSEQKSRKANRLGQMCTIYIYGNLVWWKEVRNDDGTISYVTLDKEPDTITEDVHCYQPVWIEYTSGASSTGHISIHHPGGSEQHGLNHVHQFDVMKENVAPSDISKSFKTLVLPIPCGPEWSEKAVYASFDFDKTLMAETSIHDGDDEVDLNKLRDADCITKDHMTSFGQFVCCLNIPMMVTTSRRATPKEASEIKAAIQKIFPTCKTVSFGNKITAKNDKERAFKKARDKTNRIRAVWPDLWHFDDEEIVATYRGFGSTVIDGADLKVHIGDSMSPIHTTYTINGPVGAGKSTLIAYILKKGGYVVPGVNDDGKSRLAVACGSDNYQPDHTMVPHDIFHATFPERETLVIYDTTGHGREGMPFTSIHLAADLTPVNMIGCLSSIFQRADHPNLNGLFEVDLSAPPAQVSPFDTNHMSLTDFLNHVWTITGNSPNALENIMARIGQNASFQIHGGELYVITKYNEGQQKWDAIWSRQNRNCVHILVRDRWVLVKAGLEAGAEMKPKANDTDGDSYSKNRSPIQDEVCKRLFTSSKNLPRESAITAKADGALIQISHITGPDMEIIYNSVMNSENEFAKILAKYSYDCLDGKAFLLISTNGTFMASKQMWSYIVTAVMHDLDLHEDPTFAQFVSEPETSLLQMWELLVIEFTHREIVMWQQLYGQGIIPADTICTHQMEMICPNRTTYLGEVHTELACSYPFGRIYSLGFRYGNVYIPHFDVEDILDSVKYNHPAFWRVHQPRHIMKMLSDLQRVSTDPDYTEEQFLHDHPYHNKTSLKHNVLDHEGFVLLVKTLQNKGYDYGKLKTMLYYMFHKPRDSTMSMLVKMVYSLDLRHFPIAYVIRETDKQLQKIHDKDVLAAVAEAMLPFYPVADGEMLPPRDPSNKKDKDLALRHAFVQIRNSGNTNKLHMFLYGNDKNNELAIAVYKVVMSKYNMDYLFHYLPLVDLQSNHMTNQQKTFKKQIENSLSVVRNIILYGFTSEEMRRHIINMKLTMPSVDDDDMTPRQAQFLSA